MGHMRWELNREGFKIKKALSDIRHMTFEIQELKKRNSLLNEPFPYYYSLATPPTAAPTNIMVVKLSSTVLVDADVQQQQMSIRYPKEELQRLDIVKQMQF